VDGWPDPNRLPGHRLVHTDSYREQPEALPRNPLSEQKILACSGLASVGPSVDIQANVNRPTDASPKVFALEFSPLAKGVARI